MTDDEEHAPPAEASEQPPRASSLAASVLDTVSTEPSAASPPASSNGSVPATEDPPGLSEEPSVDEALSSGDNDNAVGSDNNDANDNFVADAASESDPATAALSSVGNSPEAANNSIPFVVFPLARSQQQQERIVTATLWLNECCRRICLMVTYPMMVLISIIGLVVVLLFCVLPTMLFLGMGICCYYCTHSEPLPLSVLLRNLLAGEGPSGNPNRNPFHTTHRHHHDPDSEQIKARRVLYRSKIVVRKLLSVESVVEDKRQENDIRHTNWIIDHRSGNKKPYNPHPVMIRGYHYPIEIWTDHKSLIFSAPLSERVEEDKKTDVEMKTVSEEDNDLESNNNAVTPEFVPHYQRSIEIEPSNQNSNAAVSIPLGNVIDSNLEDDTCRCRLASCNATPRGDSDSDSDSDTSSITNDTGKENGGKDETRSGPVSCSPTSGIDYFGVEDDTRDSGTACDICILEFEPGDEIAWSPNMNCSHAFHKDCILDWLVRKPTCPMCRQNYVQFSTVDSETEDS